MLHCNGSALQIDARRGDMQLIIIGSRRPDRAIKEFLQ
jgi:hypothetical protein